MKQQKHSAVQSSHNLTARKLKGKKIDGVVMIQRVPFHIKGFVKKYFIKTQRCLIQTRVNKELNVPAEAVKHLL